jgi:hypothetical protein
MCVCRVCIIPNMFGKLFNFVSKQRNSFQIAVEVDWGHDNVNVEILFKVHHLN